jgi:hypothetical protein
VLGFGPSAVAGFMLGSVVGFGGVVGFMLGGVVFLLGGGVGFMLGGIPTSLARRPEARQQPGASIRTVGKPIVGAERTRAAAA